MYRCTTRWEGAKEGDTVGDAERRLAALSLGDKDAAAAAAAAFSRDREYKYCDVLEHPVRRRRRRRRCRLTSITLIPRARRALKKHLVFQIFGVPK